jgi:uncharacterized protein
MSLDPILLLGGLLAGLLSGILGIGGGSVLVPLMVYLGFTPINGIATSSWAILLTSLSGSIQNWRMGYLNWAQISSLGFPAILTAQLGAALAQYIPAHWLLFGFAALMLINIYLVCLKQQVAESSLSDSPTAPSFTRWHKIRSNALTGSVAGLVGGLVGVGGGAIIVPLQMMLLKKKIKVAIQTSLGVVVLTALSATLGHHINGHVLFPEGSVLGIGGLLGAQLGTRYLPKLSDRLLYILFQMTLLLISMYSFTQGLKIMNS